MKKTIFCLALAVVVLCLVGVKANATCPDCSAVVWINDDDQCFLEVTACLRDYGEGNYVIWYRPEYLLGYKALGLEYIDECDTNCHLYHAIFEIDCAALYY